MLERYNIVGTDSRGHFSYITNLTQSRRVFEDIIVPFCEEHGYKVSHHSHTFMLDNEGLLMLTLMIPQDFMIESDNDVNW